jgi:DNA polymerase-3 subunit gamma/tau
VSSADSQNLGELWQQILAGLELPSTRMLLSQQAHLHRLDDRRAVVRVSGNWIAMVQSRLPLLEGAMAKALGSPRQVSLEAGGDPAPPGGPSPGPAPERPPIIEAARPPEAPAGSGTAPAAIPVMAAAQHPAGQHPSGPEAGLSPTAPAAGSCPSEPVGQPGVPQAQPPSTPGNPAFHQPSRLDQKARLLADFFNGDVIDDSPSP